MKLKKLIIALAISSITLGNNVWCYADEIPLKEINILNKEEYTNENSLMEQEKLRIGQEILEEIKNSPATLSEAEINPMDLSDIDPITNPASDNWLTREVARQVNKDNPADLTQNDFNKIIKIDLDNMQLTKIPMEIGSLINLQSLNLSDNQLTEIPMEIGNLTNLKSLDLGYNQLTEMPMEIGSLINLQSLDLGCNQLTKIPMEIGNLINLKSLSLEMNKLTKIPMEIGNLVNLECLTLNVNELTEIPMEIGNLINLEILFLQGNQITKIPTKISNLTNLRRLCLTNNQITEIPNEFSNLTNLQYLSLEYNQLTEIPMGIYNLTNLYFLDLTSNQITKIPMEIGDSPNLEYLCLNYQDIRLNNKYIEPYKKFTIQNSINIFDTPVSPDSISNNGTYNSTNNTITWLASDTSKDETFVFSQSTIIGKITINFSGTVTLPIKLSKEKPLSLTFSNNVASQTIDTNETLSIPIALKGTGDYYALDTQIEYNSELLEFKGYSVKNGLKAYYSSNENNTLRYILASQGKDNPINSSVSDIVYLNFTPKKTGITDIKIKSGKIANLDKEVDINDLGSISITIEEQTQVKDINRDGKFTLIDLAIDGYYYGMNVNETDNTKYETDIISDGKIDDTDLKEIVKHILNNPDYSK